MKKFFTILALISFIALNLSSCTEEEVKPSSTQGTGGGSGSSVGGF